MTNEQKVNVYGAFFNEFIYSYKEGETLPLGDWIDLNSFNQTLK